MNKAAARAWSISQGTTPEPISKAELTTTEAAKRLGMTAETIRRRCDDGTVKSHYVGKHRRIYAADIDALLGKAPPVAPAPTEQPDWARRLEQKVDTLLSLEAERARAVLRATQEAGAA